MSDQTIQYSEEMVGAGHPTKEDTLNRLALVETGGDGHGKYRYLASQATAPATGAAEGVLYAKLAGGKAEAFYRGPDSASEARLTRQGELADLLRARQVAGLLLDEQNPCQGDATLGYLRFSNADQTWGWCDFKAWLAGVAWRIKLEAMLSTGESAQVGLGLAYQVFGVGAVINPVKKRWKASTAYALNDQRVPSTPNGYYYQVTVAGTSAATAPTWPTVIGNTVSDGPVTWRCQAAGLKGLSLNVTAPSSAYARFDVDSSSLQIPAGEVSLGDRVHLGLWRSATDPHGGDLLVSEMLIQPVEV
ncbi:MAG: hypothetical protein V1806_07305 [Pseudomonadota bacterium]